MTVHITPGGVSAICAVITLLVALMGFYVYAIVNKVVTRAIRDLNGYYVRSHKSQMTGHEIENRIMGLERDIRAVDSKLDDLLDKVILRMDRSMEIISNNLDDARQVVTKLGEYTHNQVHELSNMVHLVVHEREKL